MNQSRKGFWNIIRGECGLVIEMKDLYILVHEEATKENRKVRKEIQRIKREEKHIMVNGKPTVVDYEMPQGYRLLVCGAYHGKEPWDHRCVDEHLKALRREGHSPELYLPATISLDP